MEKFYTKAQITQAAKQDAEFVAVASTAIEDRHGEIVSVEGWDIKKFKEDPVLLWAHDHYEMAVGQAKKIWVEGTGKKAKLMIEGFIHEHTDKARALKQLVKEGIIKTMSVGFRPIDMDGNTFTSQELLEVSFVNVPANPQALISAYKSLSDAGFEKKTMSDIGIPVAILEELDAVKKDVSQLRDEFTAVKALNGQQPPVNPHGRSKRVLKERISMLKVIARAGDKLVESEKSQTPVNRADLAKVVKRASESLIVSHKEELNGTNQRTAGKEKGRYHKRAGAGRA